MYEKERRSQAYYDRRAPIYDSSNRIAALLRGTSAIRERRKAVQRLGLGPGARALEVSVGTGTNLPLMAEAVGAEGSLVGLDISNAMLGRCREKLSGKRVAAELVLGEASRLPFAGNSFDAVFHHGGIAEFGDAGGAIEEMMRVAKPGARVVICDVGVPTDRKLSLANRLLMRFQPDYRKPPPLESVPRGAQDTQLSWFHGGGWYMLEFTKPSA
jgi:ubiquinone/menaquinone biosynthesis C-methylase UbiE